MATAAVQLDRRMLAILAADVVGYAHLMEVDEPGTIARLRAVRAEVVDPLVAGHHGRLVKLMGDGALVTFESVVDAVTCAVGLQRTMATRNAGLPEAERIVFRIGVNLGDVALVEGDIYGDGVNVAARLEQLCDPGGVMVSGTAYDQLHGKLDLALDFAGEQQVKNIARPVRAYRVRLDGMRRRRHPGARRLGRRLLPLAAAMVMALLGVAAAWWFWPVEPARTNPSIAVLPFTNYGGDEATARLADGITEDIITDLARFRDFDVIARNSTEVYKGKPVDIRQVSQDLGVGYVLEGSIQRQGDRVRVTAQLIDAGTGAHVWSERWDRPTGDVFAVQSELAERVAVRLGGGLRAAAIASNEASRAKRRVPADLTAYDHYLLALEAKVQRTPASLARAMAHLDEALALDPALARGYVARAWLHWFSLDFGAEYDAVIRAMEADVRRAVELDPHDPEARATLAVYYSIVGRWAECEAELTAALEENPANATVLTIVASTLPFLGKPEEGVAYAEKALRLDPRMPRAHLSGVRDTMFFGRRFEEALSILSRMGPENWGRTDFLEAAASYAYLGRTEEAADARARLLSQYPDLSAELLLNEGWAFARQEEQDFFVDAVRRAGLPVCATEERLKGFERPVRLPECLTQ